MKLNGKAIHDGIYILCLALFYGALLLCLLIVAYGWLKVFDIIKG